MYTRLTNAGDLKNALILSKMENRIGFPLAIDERPNT